VKPRILIIDDDFGSLCVLTEALAPIDAHLAFASTLRVALEMLTTEGDRYELILLERCLPDSDGLEFLRLLKQDERFARTRVIMQTANLTSNRVAEGFEAGATYYVAKPIQPDLLRALVRSALSEASDRDSLRPRERTACAELRNLEDVDLPFRTLTEARELAILLSGLCPEPERVALGLTELMVNAVEHGNLAISYAEKSELCRTNAWQSEIERRLALPEYKLRCAYVRVSRSADALQFSIRDDGAGFWWKEFLELDPARAFSPNGRGIALARELAFSHLEYQAPGNVVFARVPLENGA